MSPCLCFPVFEGGVWKGVRGGHEQIKRSILGTLLSGEMQVSIFSFLVYTSIFTRYCDWLSFSHLVESKPRHYPWLAVVCCVVALTRGCRFGLQKSFNYLCLSPSSDMAVVGMNHIGYEVTISVVSG